MEENLSTSLDLESPSISAQVTPFWRPSATNLDVIATIADVLPAKSKCSFS